MARRRYWDLYADCPALAPIVPPIPFARQDPHSQRLMTACEDEKYAISPEDVARARRGYFANISYVDEKIGELLDILKRCRMDENTVVLFLSDHGDMLGERGLWFKMNFFEGSARVPLMIAAPGLSPGRVDAPVSTLDVAVTLGEFAGIDLSALAPWTNGVSLLETIAAGRRREPVPMEYAAEGSEAPMVAIRDGDLKFVHCAIDPPLLFDLAADPHELRNLADDPAYREDLVRLAAMVSSNWDMAAFDASVRMSQARRHVTYAALRNGAFYPWDHQPLQKASERYMRNHMDLNILEESKRFPRGE